MKRNQSRKAFTLIEVLIVVIIMAVLAATIVPQFSASTEDAKGSSLDFNLHTMQTQLELFKLHHLGTLPTITDFVDQMTKPTNQSGGSTGDTPYGPYIQGEIPYNPFNNSNEVVAVATEGSEPSDVVDGGAAGWQYDQSTGRIYPNNSEAYE
jgi:general secretion pathway protein G